MTVQDSEQNLDQAKSAQERFFDNQVHHHEDKHNHAKNNTKNLDLVSIIYYQKKESPKYFEIRKSTFFWWLVILPAITLFSIVLVVLALVHFSPTHLIQNYLSAKNYESMKTTIEQLKNENQQLKDQLSEKIESLNIELAKNNKSLQDQEIANNQEQTNVNKIDNTVTSPTPTIPPKNIIDQKSSMAEGFKGKESGTLNLSYLSLFKPVQGQKDRTRPAQLSLGGFSVVSLRDTISLKFNITPLNPNEEKIAGHILVIMKGETGLQVYPQMSLNAPESQISYSAGEPFATQRFRPVDASFLKPRKSGQFVFTVLIFAKNGDLIHTQTVPLFVRL